jgi:serine/threonine protein kinase
MKIVRVGIRPDSNKQIWTKKYTFQEMLHVARDLASALCYLHYGFDCGIHIIHRDIKPDNIGFTAEGTVKLFDFGLCATIKSQREKTEQYKLTGNTGFFKIIIVLCSN